MWLEQKCAGNKCVSKEERTVSINPLHDIACLGKTAQVSSEVSLEDAAQLITNTKMTENQTKFKRDDFLTAGS